MNTTLLVQITGNTWQRVDVFEDIPITLTIEQNDLTNVTQRRAPYSNTILVPSSQNNDVVFEHYFEVNGLDFNPLQKIPCIVQYRGTDIFQGVMRMNAVVSNQEERLYEIFLLGEVADFAAGFRNLDLQDLNYTDLNHDLDYDNVVLSWECRNDGTSGLLGGKILYPLINYGLDYQGNSSTGATPTFSMDFGQPQSFDSSIYAMPASYFKPSIQVKTILDRIFQQTEYNVVSDFFDSEYFTSIYMDTFQNGQVGITTAEEVENQNIFRAGSNIVEFRYTKDEHHEIPFVDTNFGYDPLNNYNNASFSFRAPYSGTYGFNVKFNIKPSSALFLALIKGDVVVEAYISPNIPGPLPVGALVYQSPQITLGQIGVSEVPVNLFFSTPITAGSYIKVWIKDATFVGALGGYYTIFPFNDGTVVEPVPYWQLYESPVITSPLVDMSLGVPNIQCIDFFRGIITLFNLVVEQDETEKTIRVEPYNWFFNDPERPLRDFTNILDLNSEIRLEPLSFDLNKDLIWTYKFTDLENLPKLFFDRFDYVFGRKKFISESNLFVGEQRYEVPFGSCPTSGVTGAPNFIIPQFYYQNNQQQAPYATIPHLFFWCGNRHAYLDALKSVQGSWYLLSGSTAVEQLTYPCVSHLNTLESQFSPIISDLNFDYSFDFFGNSTNQIQQYTDFNLYNSFWKTYIENLYSPFGRRLTGSFFYRPLDVYQTQLNDKVWVKDSWWSIEKLTDADLVNKRLTKISLIKEDQPYYKIEPPAPIYILEPNEPYPVPEPFYQTLCYVSTDQEQVCLGTSPSIVAVYSFGNGTIGNLDKVYIDTGSSYQLLPMGTYVRQTTASTTFVVADIYGRVLEVDC